MARWRPPTRWREFERTPDFDVRLRPQAAAERRPAGRLPSFGSPLAQRAYSTSTRAYPVELTNVASVKDRRRADDLMQRGQKALYDKRRASPVMSAAFPKINAVSRKRANVLRAKAVAADNRLFNPTSGPKTYYGTFARIEPKSGGRFRFVLPSSVYPCIQRTTRREVLFAKGHGGRGSHKRKKFGPNSHIGC